MSTYMSCPVLTFSRAAEALEAIPTQEIGAIVTDYYMPQVDGIEFIRRVRALSPGVPFVMITGHGIEFESADLSPFPEVRAVMHKPFRWQQLAEKVIEHWNGTPPPTIREIT